MRLVALDPAFLGSGGEGVAGADGEPVPRREGVGLYCQCPCGCDRGLYVPFANPIDGGPSVEPRGWERTGDTFDTLTLRPSIQRAEPGGCRWHGVITDGEVRSC